MRDSGWQQAEFTVNVSAGTHTITVGGWNNKKTAPVEVTDIFFDEILITKQGQAILNTNLGGFQYSDDKFRGTNHPQYASGDISNGSMHTSIGGIDGVDIVNGMSGGWSSTFTLSGNANVLISLSYRLTVGNYDADECGQALVAIDGVLVSPGQQDYLEQFCGRSTRDSGWRDVQFTRNLSAGTHTITVGGWNNKKTFSTEVTDVFFNDIIVTQ